MRSEKWASTASSARMTSQIRSPTSAAQKKGGHGGPLAGGASLGPAAGAEGSLLDGQGGEALGYGADGEIAVTPRYGLLVTGISGKPQGDMGALGVALQADAERELSFLLHGQEKIAMGEIVLLGLKGEVDVAVAAVDILGGDLKYGLAGGEGIHTQEVAQRLGTSGAVDLNGCPAVPAEGGLGLCGHGHVMG